MPTPSSRGRVLLRLGGPVTLGLLLAGCGGTPSAGPAHPSPPGPDTVALSYATALFNGDVAHARELVEPASRSMFGLVAAGADPHALSARGLAVGATSISGDQASVVLTGSLCHGSAASPTTVDPARDCVANTDPRSTNPIFRVGLAQQPDHTWMISLGLPRAPVPVETDGPVETASAAAH